MITFTLWDYLAVAFTLLASTLIGLFYSFKDGNQKTTSDYLLANRSMPVFPVALSFAASYISAISMMGIPSEIYQFGAILILSVISLFLATPIVAYVMLPVFKSTSIYQYLEQRFGMVLKITVSLIYSGQQIFYIAIALYAPALALETVTGFDRFLAIGVIGLVCTFYSTIGGIKAVIATDIFQGFLMVVPLLAVFTCAVMQSDSFTNMWTVAAESNRLKFDVFSFDPTIRYSFWSVVLGNLAIYVTQIGANQVYIQRLSAVKDLKASQQCLWWNFVFLAFVQTCLFLASIAIFSYYKDCDPVLEGRIGSRDQLLPLFVMDTMSGVPGLPGLMISGIFCGTLSSISSVINSLSAIFLEDYLKPLNKVCCQVDFTGKLSLLTTKALTLCFGIACTSCAFLGDYFGGLLETFLKFSAVIAGPVLGVFLLGMLTITANHIGTLFGLVTGITFTSYLLLAQPKAAPQILELSTNSCLVVNPLEASFDGEEEDYFWLYNLSFVWYSLIGTLTTFVCGYLWSWILFLCRFQVNGKIYKDHGKLDETLFSPVFVKYLNALGFKGFKVESNENSYIGGNPHDLY